MLLLLSVTVADFFALLRISSRVWIVQSIPLMRSADERLFCTFSLDNKTMVLISGTHCAPYFSPSPPPLLELVTRKRSYVAYSTRSFFLRNNILRMREEEWISGP